MVLDASAAELAPDVIKALGARARLSDELNVADLRAGGRRLVTGPRAQDDDVSLAPMPGSRDTSARAFVLPLGDGVLVPELEESAFEAIGLVHERALGRLVQTFLDVQVAELEQAGVDVARLPMMPPVDLERVEERAESWLGTFVSPADALLLTDGARQLAFLPRLDDERFPAAYRDIAAVQRERWSEFFRARGREVVFIDVTALALAGRSLRSLGTA
jgi:hypothetical protein